MTVTIFPNPFPSDTPVHEGLPLSVYQEVLHLLAERMSEDQFRCISPTVLQQTQRLLDPLQQGLSLCVLQCTPPATGKPVQSLSLRLDQGASSRIEEIPVCPLFFGAQSLSAFAVSSGHVAFVPSTTAPQERKLFVNWHHAQSIAAHPIKRFGRCAGSLTAFSSFPLQRPDLLLLQEAANLLSFAIPEQDFFADEQIAFQLMPPLQTQIDYLSLFSQRFLNILSKARRSGQMLSITQAEDLVLQQFEQELSQLVFRDRGAMDTVA